MTYGRSVAKAMRYYLIDFNTWPVLAANRASWREAINGGLRTAGRPRRVAAVETNRRIDATVAALRTAGGAAAHHVRDEQVHLPSATTFRPCRSSDFERHHTKLYMCL